MANGHGFLHVFVAMPFGVKDGIDFNAVHEHLIRPALEGAGFVVLRADEEQRAGQIRADMFQELLLADLVVVDLSIDNPNVWYELGVRHALRKRGVVPIQCRRDYLPFDVYTDRTLRYSVTASTADAPAVPDPAKLASDRERLAKFAVETVRSWHGRIVSPVYAHLRDLAEPDWHQLRSDQALEYWERYEVWRGRISAARLKGRAGDLVLLAGEAPARLFRLDALRAAAGALRSLGNFTFALRMVEEALELAPRDLDSRRQKGILLGRLGRAPEARTLLEELAEAHAKDAETLALLGRLDKDDWVTRWQRAGASPAQMRDDAASEEAYLLGAVQRYAKAFAIDPTHYYSGINAATLAYLYHHLLGRSPDSLDLAALGGGVRWATLAATRAAPDDYWARVTLADLELLTGDVPAIEGAYRAAVSKAKRDWFALDSSRQQLQLLTALGFRPEHVAAGLAVLERELARLEQPVRAQAPAKVILFSGHMIDRAGRPEPRFPADQKDVAAKAIAAKLDELGAGPNDLALCGGACGGDLLFAEACQARGVRLELRLPLVEPEFLEQSVRFAGESWQKQFHAVCEKAREIGGANAVQVLPEEIGPTPPLADPFSRNNLWQLYSALAHGAEKVHFIALWDGRAGDGPGGTEHMMTSVKREAGKVYHLWTRKLFGFE